MGWLKTIELTCPEPCDNLKLVLSLVPTQSPYNILIAPTITITGVAHLCLSTLQPQASPNFMLFPSLFVPHVEVFQQAIICTEIVL